MNTRVRVLFTLVAVLATLGLGACGHYTCGATFGASTCTPAGGGVGGGSGGGGTISAANASALVYYMSGSNIQGAGIGGSTFAPLAGYTAPAIAAGFADVMLVTKKYVYVPAGNSNVEGFSIDRKSGALTAISGSPFTVTGSSGTTDGAWSDPQGRFLFVGSEGSGDIWVFQINPTTGALTETAGSPFTSAGAVVLSSADIMTVDASGKFLYVGQGSASAAVAAFSIDQTTGALTPVPGSPFTTMGVAQIRASLTGEFLLGVAQIQDAGAATDTHIHVFSINPATGVPTEVSGSPFATGSAPFDFAISPNGKFVYTVGTDTVKATTGAIEGFQMDLTSGALTTLSGSPFTALPTAQQCMFDQGGADLVCSGSTSLFVLGASATNGALTNAATFSGSGGFPFGVTD
jgi:6-phosphogluconolactonase (cycloisomerase 2 family)